MRGLYIRFLGFVIVVFAWSTIHAQAPITFQGFLRNARGQPADGFYDFIFTLYDAAAAGNVIGNPVNINNLLVRNGLFTVELNFGPPGVVWAAPPSRWIEIRVRPAGMGNFVVLAPRVKINPTPFAWTPVGPAGGDLGGNYPNPLVTRLFSKPLQDLTVVPPVLGDLLSWDGLRWSTMGGAPQGGGNPPNGFNGDILFWNAVAKKWVRMGAAPAVGNVIRWNGAAWVPTPIIFNDPAGGDLFGNYPNPMVAGIRGRPVDPSLPQTGQVLKWNGVMWAPANDLTDGSFTLPFSGGAAVVDGATFAIANPAPNGEAVAILGASDSPGGIGVVGKATHSAGGAGVMGISTASSGDAYGVIGRASSSSGTGIFGEATASSGNTYGVRGTSSSSSGIGIFGEATASSGNTYGVRGTSSSSSGIGIFGEATASSGNTYGVRGTSSSSSGIGIFGEATASSGNTYGVRGTSSSSNGTGIFGEATASSGNTYGVRGTSSSSSGIGIFGEATASSGNTYGVRGTSSSSSGIGIFGEATASSGNTYGVVGRVSSSSGTGVFGEATATTGSTHAGYFRNSSDGGIGAYGHAISISGTNYGVVGRSESPQGRGVVGVVEASTGTNYGVLGRTSSSNGWGVYAQGRLGASGTKSFQIDHPLYPETHFLNHFCTEAPEPLNAYSGNVVTDARGYAVVQLPDYFEAINRDFRYQLTVIDASEDFVQAKVVRKIQNNQFVIRTSKPFVEVSWRVEAVRNDRWVQQYGFQTEQVKPEEYQGKYLHPELYGEPTEKGIFTPTAPIESNPTKL